jgi:hypothetical protein
VAFQGTSHSMYLILGPIFPRNVLAAVRCKNSNFMSMKITTFTNLTK